MMRVNEQDLEILAELRVACDNHERGGYVLTHSEWHRCNMGVDLTQYQSGLHYPDGTFGLIQHGMCDFARAERMIWRAVDKGWDAKRMTDVLRWLRNRRTQARLL